MRQHARLLATGRGEWMTETVFIAACRVLVDGWHLDRRLVMDAAHAAECDGTLSRIATSIEFNEPYWIVNELDRWLDTLRVLDAARRLGRAA
ncbi:hypothetical protein LCGC14_0750140 [marine sediment metagenome]|uniref:Uncharacterized protein n=1 Tax=marine sediment metagenome TaxID=412755 RepID=A0A0F9SP60_9ZZZZ